MKGEAGHSYQQSVDRTFAFQNVSDKTRRKIPMAIERDWRAASPVVPLASRSALAITCETNQTNLQK